MESERISEIIALALSGEADRKEKQILEDWINESEENRQMFEILKEDWRVNQPSFKVVSSDELKNKIWAEGTGLANGRKPIGSKGRKPDYTFFMKIAAIIVLFISVAFVIFEQVYVSKETKTEEVWVKKSNPPGQKSKVFLPDGSEAWLNAGSELRYPERFTDSSRIIYLEGEAFFEVVKDLRRPFIVISNNISTTALGTSFNVNGSDEEVKVALVTGKVKIDRIDSGVAEKKQIILDPGQSACFDNNKKQFTIDSFNAEEVIGWKDGVLIFRDADFDQVARELEMWYDVNISIEGGGKVAKHYTGKFTNENLRNVLESMSFALDFEFELNDKKVQIYVD